MAEPTRSPSLPSTADAAPYVPVSWAAAAAAAVAGVFLLTLVAFGYFAFANKKPLLMEELLLLPAIAIVLSFAARRMIRNSEGTRTGLLYGVDLVAAAWWVALVVGLCYIAYLFAIDRAITRDARGEVDRWMGSIAKGTEDDNLLAFHRTLPPGKRQNVSPNDKYQMRVLFRDDLLGFENSDLVRLAQRNRGAFEYAPGGVTWKYTPGKIDCTATGTATCPEGTFPVLVPLQGLEGVTGGEGGGAGRQWMVVRPPGGGFLDQRAATRTGYGWLVLVLETDGGAFGKGFVSHLATGPGSRSYAYRAFVVPGGDRQGWGAVALDPGAQFAFAIPAQALGDAGYADYMANQFYKLPGGGEPSPDQKRKFAATWDAQGLRPAGEKLKDASGGAIDKEDVITLTDTAVEVRVPVEIPLLNPGKLQVARGRVVVACTDPALLDELKALKASANPSQGTASPSEDLVRRKAAWRVVRVESDLAPVEVAPPGPPGGPGGPGGAGRPH